MEEADHPLFKGKIKYKKLRRVMELTSIAVDEARIRIQDKGWNIREVDPAHVCMIDMDVGDDTFEEYIFNEKGQTEDNKNKLSEEEINELHERYVEAKEEAGEEYLDFDEWKDIEYDEPTSNKSQSDVGVSVDKIMELLRNKEISRGDTITLIIPDDSHRLVIQVKEKKMERIMPLLDTAGMTDANIPKLDLPHQFQVSGRELIGALNSLKDVSDHINFNLTEKTLILNTEEDEDSAMWEIDRDDMKEVNFDTDELPMKTIFAEDYLSAFISKIKKYEAVDIQIGQEYPIKMNMDVDDTVHLNGLLAPRIEG